MTLKSLLYFLAQIIRVVLIKCNYYKDFEVGHITSKNRKLRKEEGDICR